MQRSTRWTWAVRLALACALCAVGTAHAQRMEGDRAAAQGLYGAEVAVKGQGEAERKAGFARALAEVLAKLSGDGNAASQPGVRTELGRAEDYVASYDYRQDEGRSASGAPTFQTTLVVRFQQDRVDAIASALGLPIWPAPRPKPVLWLAIDDGSGPRLVALGQNDVARSVLQRAVQRGFRLGLPTGTAAEQAAVGAIWRGDTATIARLSSRYSLLMQLIGKLYRGESGWVADWTFVDNGRVLSSWSSSDRDARQAMAAGADGAADALTKRYAKRSPAGPPGKYRIVFSGIDNSDDYIRLSGLLQDMSVVRGIAPVRANQAGLELELELLTGLAGFRSMADDNVLLEVGGEPDVATTIPGIPVLPAVPAEFRLL